MSDKHDKEQVVSGGSGGSTNEAQAQIAALEEEISRLRRSVSHEQNLRDAVLTHSPHGIIVTDVEGRLIAQNAAAEKIWAGSATAKDFSEWGQYRAYHPDGTPFSDEDWALKTALRGEVQEAREVHIQRFDGSHGYVLGSSAPILDDDGEIAGALTVFADITVFKRQEEAIRIGGEQYFTTLQSIGDAVISTDESGRVVYLNPVAEELTGWTLDEARGRPCSEVFHIVNEHTRAEVESPVDKVIREGQIVGLANHTILIAKHGGEICIDDSGAPIFNSRKELVGVVLVFRDVTQKRREEARRTFIAEASAALVSSLDYHDTLSRVSDLAIREISDWCAVDILEASGSLKRLAVSHIDPSKVELASELAERYPPDPTSPYGVHEVIRTGRSMLMAEIPEEVLLAGAVDDEHLRIIKELQLRSAMIVPLRCRGRTLGALTFVSTDPLKKFSNTDLALAEELSNVAALAVDNARLYREAQHANRSKDEFLTTVSHELRTPLNAILGWANLLRTGSVAEEKRAQGIETIERNARAQAQLIEDLLDMSRIISGNLKLEMRSLDLAKVVQNAVEAVQLAAEAKGVQIDVVVDDEATQAIGDAGRLQQVIWNLLSNAVKFTPRGGEVTVRLRQYESQAEIVVSDTGRGIDPVFLPHLFERFKQEQATTTRTQGGLGIGLAIVKHLVELHGGTVHAESQGSDTGSSFHVRLPLTAVVRRPESVTPTDRRVLAPRLDGLRILIVDDEPDARELIKEVLEGHGAEVTAVSCAADALAELRQWLPDVLVSDIGMPHVDGYTLMRKVRAMMADQPAVLPAVALTAYARSEDRTRAMLAGFQSHVAKPVEVDELLIVVATLAGRTSSEWPE